MTNHTPEPWMQSGHVVRADGEIVADCYAEGGHADRAICNARLIAAAPEMLRALLNLDRLRNDGKCAADELGAIGGKDIAAFVLQYRAAIAKATKTEEDRPCPP